MKECIVAICLPVYASPKQQMIRSINQLWRPWGGNPEFPGACYTFDAHGILITEARTGLTDDALRAHESGGPKVTHVLFIDDDMVFPPYALKQLVDRQKPIVGGLCHNRRQPFNPIAARRHRDEQDLSGAMGFLYHLPQDGLVEVDATGAAFLLIEREVFEAIDKKYGRGQWWQSTDRASEDFSFCERARACGYKIHIDVGLDIGHVAEVVVDRAFASKNRSLEVNPWIDDPGLADGSPVASIVIPTYNQHPRILRAAVLSAAHQTRPVEVIVVDDGTHHGVVPDAGWPPNVRVLRHALDRGDVHVVRDRHGWQSDDRPANRGIAAALNTGIADMKTEWFCWLSSDDLADPRKVERQLHAMRSTGARASFHNYQSYMDQEPFPRLARMVAWRSINQQRTVLAAACAINGSTVMVHKGIIEDLGGFNSEYRYGQDWEWFCRVGEKYLWHPIEEVLGTRREHDNLTAQIEGSAVDDPRRLRRDAEDASIRERYLWPLPLT